LLFKGFTPTLFYSISNYTAKLLPQPHDDEADYQTQYIEFLDKYNFSDDDEDDKKK
jgi:hypothetical protein